MSIRSILCPVDFSATSEEALRYAVSLASQLGVTEVHLLHVHQPPAVTLPNGSSATPDGAADAKNRAARELESMAKRYSAHGAAVIPHLVEGVPYEAIVAGARTMGADMIVIGTHGRTGLKHALLGSVAERVTRLSPVPVCSVRTAA